MTLQTHQGKHYRYIDIKWEWPLHGTPTLYMVDGAGDMFECIAATYLSDA